MAFFFVSTHSQQGNSVYFCREVICVKKQIKVPEVEEGVSEAAAP